MKNTFRTAWALLTALTLSSLIAAGCDSGAKERVAFAQNMTAPAEGLTASTRGTENEILVIQISGTAPSHPENLVQGKSLTQLQKRGFKRVEVRGSDGKTMVEKDVN
jgi:hypothetical protein